MWLFYEPEERNASGADLLFSDNSSIFSALARAEEPHARRASYFYLKLSERAETAMTAKKLELKERELDGALAIDVIGELTVGSGTETLLDVVRKTVADGRRLLLVNLSQCRRVDSSGIGELVTCLVTATRHDAVLRLTSIPQQIRGLMKMTNVLKAFEVFDTDEAAAKQ
jgi:anti-sigma B factor antagonist